MSSDVDVRGTTGENNSKILMTTLLNSFIASSASIVLSIVSLQGTFPKYLYELHRRILILNLSFLLITIVMTHNIKIKNLNENFLSKILLIFLLYIASLKAITLFSNEYLVNPFDTTGLRGFIEDLVMNGRVPRKGFYIEYAGAYDTLPIGPILTSILYYVYSYGCT
jgi:hypothetical protein